MVMEVVDVQSYECVFSCICASVCVWTSFPSAGRAQWCQAHHRTYSSVLVCPTLSAISGLGCVCVCVFICVYAPG